MTIFTGLLWSAGWGYGVILLFRCLLKKCKVRKDKIFVAALSLILFFSGVVLVFSSLLQYGG